ncbi:unnamed protein product, partial [Discosporangium mesarthrocarpum]
TIRVYVKAPCKSTNRSSVTGRGGPQQGETGMPSAASPRACTCCLYAHGWCHNTPQLPGREEAGLTRSRLAREQAGHWTNRERRRKLSTTTRFSSLSVLYS